MIMGTIVRIETGAPANGYNTNQTKTYAVQAATAVRTRGVAAIVAMPDMRASAERGSEGTRECMKDVSAPARQFLIPVFPFPHEGCGYRGGNVTQEHSIDLVDIIAEPPVVCPDGRGRLRGS
jgi:hypothetical protein